MYIYVYILICICLCSYIYECVCVCVCVHNYISVCSNIQSQPVIKDNAFKAMAF